MIQVFKDLTREAWLELRSADLTSTEIPSLFGLSPYATGFETWHRHNAGTIVALEGNDRMKWGSRLEASIAAGIAEDNGWQVTPMTSYIRDTERRLGASFDFAIGDDGILEIKNVDALQFREKWLIDGDDIEAPPHIEMQTQQQLMLSGRKYAYIGALVGGNRVVLIKREPQQAVFDAIIAKAAEFWKSIDEKREPNPSFPEDAMAVIAMSTRVQPGTVMSASPVLTAMAYQYKAVLEEQKILEESKATLKAKMLLEMGEAEKILGDGFSISAGLIAPTRVEAYDRAGYRGFRVTHKKVKA